MWVAEADGLLYVYFAGQRRGGQTNSPTPASAHCAVRDSTKRGMGKSAIPDR